MSITVLDDPGFNDAADFGMANPSMDAAVIEMPNLNAMLRGFDTAPAQVAPGSFVAAAHAGVAGYGDYFASLIDQSGASTYWGGTPKVAATPTASFADVGISGLAALGESLGSSFGAAASAPAGIDMSGFSQAPTVQTENPTFNNRYNNKGNTLS